MTQPSVLSAVDFEKLRALDTCTVCNAIDGYGPNSHRIPAHDAALLL